MPDVSPLAQALAQRFSDFRRSDNIEDRRYEHFNSRPELQRVAPGTFTDGSQQMPNVFVDGLMTGLNPNTDFAPIPQPNQLSDAAGASVLQGKINQYLAERQGPSFGSLPAIALGR